MPVPGQPSEDDDDTAPRKYDIVLPEKKCYFCGRTKEDMEKLVAPVISQLDASIKAFRDDITNADEFEKRKLLEIIRRMEKDPGNLKLTLKAISSDIWGYNRKIPYMSDVLLFVIKGRVYNESLYPPVVIPKEKEPQTLEQVMGDMRKVVGTKSEDLLQKLEQDRKYLSFRLTEIIIRKNLSESKRFSETEPHYTLTVPVCGICSEVLRIVGEGSFGQIHRDL
jgi:hypothetical protein